VIFLYNTSIQLFLILVLKTMRTLTPIQRCSVDDIPGNLKHIPKPPRKLSYVGKLPSPDLKFITIVGSRKASTYAQNVTRKLVAEMAHFPIAIVSGLAYGIDHCAHEAALEHNVPTIAFPGSGLESSVLYPAGHRRLAESIVMAGGCLISEFKDDQGALPWTFPVRNRLMAGIADVVIIIEAREKSGSLITAREALDYGTTVMVVPGPIYNERCLGSNQLIYDGATPTLSGKTILHELGFAIDTIPTDWPQRNYTPNEQIIADLLYQPRTRDELARTSKLSISEMNQTLSEMEMHGYTQEQNGMISLR
jgi:DNA processing protein